MACSASCAQAAPRIEAVAMARHVLVGSDRAHRAFGQGDDDDRGALRPAPVELVQQAEEVREGWRVAVRIEEAPGAASCSCWAPSVRPSKMRAQVGGEDWLAGIGTGRPSAAGNRGSMVVVGGTGFQNAS